MPAVATRAPAYSATAIVQAKGPTGWTPCPLVRRVRRPPTEHSSENSVAAINGHSARGSRQMGHAEYKVKARKDEWEVEHDGKTSGPFETREAAFDASVDAARAAMKQGHSVTVDVEKPTQIIKIATIETRD
jgi:hypothetical protein